jgi:hypothetical protein
MRDMEKWAQYAQARIIVERHHEWEKWQMEIPFISFLADWEVRVIPPVGGAIVRFIVRHKQTKNSCSVYLDCYGELGGCDVPYWEVYPYHGDCHRCEMENTEELLQTIKESIS